jgi:ABC-2 type transport system permease protein
MMLLRIGAIALKETRQIRRDPLLLLWAFGLPLVMLVLFGYAISLDIDEVPLVVVDPVPTTGSRELRDQITASGYFKLAAVVASAQQLERHFISNTAKIALIMPPRFDEKASRGESLQLQLIVDGSDNNTALIAMGYLQHILTNHNQRVIINKAMRDRTTGGLGARLDVKTRVFYNPELKSRYFIIPGVISTVLGMMSVILTALCLAREYERGTMEQLLVSPLSRFEIIVGKLIPYFVIGCIEVLTTTLCAALLFEVPLRGSLVAIFMVSMLFLLAGLGQGLFISVATRSQQVATQAGLVSSMLPSLLLSGFMFPVSSMPQVIQWVSLLIPARHLLDMLRALMLKGVPVWILWPKMLFLLLVSALFYVQAFRRMGKRLG